MKLVNAKLYEEQIKRKMWEIWYDEKYQYYFGGNWRSDLSLADNNSDYPKRAFAVLNNRDELIGYISYSVDNELRIAQWFGAINFSDDKLTFGRALRQVIEDCFLKFGMEVVEWYVICGNPIDWCVLPSTDTFPASVKMRIYSRSAGLVYGKPVSVTIARRASSLHSLSDVSLTK